MKLFKSISAYVLALFMIVVCSVGCSAVKKFPQTANDITVKFWDSGVGSEFLKKTVEQFQIKYPEYRVWTDISSNRKDIVNDFGQGEEIDGVDVWMFPVDSISSKTLAAYAEPLNDILGKTYGDESKTIGEKYEPAVLEALQWPDGNYYSLSYSGGWYGIVYNETIIDGENYRLPRTTQELEELTIELAADPALKNMRPYIHYAEGGYWNFVYNVWQAQYDGMDYYTNTFMPLDGGESDPAPSKNVLTKQDGRYQAIQALERILKPAYVYSGSNSLAFTDAQTLFIKDRAVMMVNGSWMLNEMQSVEGATTSFKIMKNPVISAIIDKCPTITGENGGTADEELCALIDAVDAASSSAAVPLTGNGYSVSLEDAARVYEARNIMSNNFDAHGIIIPTYSSAKEGAKLFIEYFYSDENLKNYWDTTQLPLPVTYSNGEGPDMTGWTEWSIQQQEYAKTAIPMYLIQRTASPVFTAGGADPYADVNIVSKFTSENANDRLTAAEAWDSIISIFNKNWENYLTNAQL